MARRNIALLVQTANDWHRQILRGVASYAYERGGWDFYVTPSGLHEEPSLPESWQGDGIITRLVSKKLTESICQRGIPSVNVSWLGEHSADIPKVVSDEAACGILVAEYYLDSGYSHLAYVRPLGRPGYGELLGDSFAERAAESNCKTSHFPSVNADLSRPPREWRDDLATWLTSLSHPLGLLVWNSRIGREVIAASRQAGLRVPDDVAIVCSEHDPLMSSLATIPLSNLEQVPTSVGYKAASLLERMIQGEPSPTAPIIVPPVGIVQRQSSDSIATEDEVVSEAIRFIRQNCDRPILVRHVQAHLGISRRALEHKFTLAINRSPAAVIRRARIERVKRQLVETDLPIATIAGQTGFNHAEVLIRTFRRELGISPGEFRKRQLG